MAEPIGTYQGKPRRDEWPLGPKRSAPVAEREPLSGWDPTPNGRYHVMTFGMVEMWVTDEGYEVDMSGTSDGKADGRTSAQLAAENAARAMVADMAKALGGSVTWATDERTCVWTDSPEVWSAACGWGSFMLPCDPSDNARNGFCGGCGGRIVLAAATAAAAVNGGE